MRLIEKSTERDLQLHVTRHRASASSNIVALPFRHVNHPSTALLEGVVLQGARSTHTIEIDSAHLENIRTRILSQDNFLQYFLLLSDIDEPQTFFRENMASPILTAFTISKKIDVARRLMPTHRYNAKPSFLW